MSHVHDPAVFGIWRNDIPMKSFTSLTDPALLCSLSLFQPTVNGWMIDYRSQVASLDVSDKGESMLIMITLLFA